MMVVWHKLSEGIENFRISGALKELLETSYNELEIYQDWGNLLVIV